jgi:[acyl-carrier-protein] S-malonyltransferase
VPANYNSPGQVVISGTISGIDRACELLSAAGAKRTLKLKVGGAFHSPLMEPAREELAKTIESVTFNKPACPVYQDVDARPQIDPAVIKANLIVQLTSPVRWTQIIENMITDGVCRFIELGPGAILQGLIKKINGNVTTGVIF